MATRVGPIVGGISESSSSARAGLLPWMSLFQRVYKLDSVCCYRISDLDEESSLPLPRASHSLNFVSDYLVLFGGGREGGKTKSSISFISLFAYQSA